MGNTNCAIDKDKPFLIDSTTKNVTNQSQKSTLVQYDTNSESFSFVLDQFIDGHDMEQCTSVSVHFYVLDAATRRKVNASVYPVPAGSDGKILRKYTQAYCAEVGQTYDAAYEGKLIFSWLISNYVTQNAGVLYFAIALCCTETDAETGLVEVKYRWSTNINNSININSGLDNSEEMITVSTDAIQQLYSEVRAAVTKADGEINDAIEGLDTQVNDRVCLEFDNRCEEGYVLQPTDFASTSEVMTLLEQALELEGVEYVTNVPFEDVVEYVDSHHDSTKLDTPLMHGFYQYLVGKSAMSEIDSFNLTENANYWSVPYRDGSAKFKVGQTSVSDTPSTVASKSYVDFIGSHKQDKLTAGPNIVIDQNGTISAEITNPSTNTIYAMYFDNSNSKLVSSEPSTQTSKSITFSTTEQSIDYLFDIPTDNFAVSPQSLYNLCLILNGLSTLAGKKYMFRAEWRNGGTVISESSLITIEPTASTDLIGIPMPTNFLTERLVLNSGAALTLRIYYKTNMGDGAVNILSGPGQQSAFVRNGSEVAANNVYDSINGEQRSQSYINHYLKTQLMEQTLLSESLKGQLSDANTIIHNTIAQTVEEEFTEVDTASIPSSIIVGETAYPVIDGARALLTEIKGKSEISKNLLPYPYKEATKTVNGITFTDNGDGTVTVNGTATGDASYIMHSFNDGLSDLALGKQYTISGCPLGGGASTYYLCFEIINKGTWAQGSNDYGASRSLILGTIGTGFNLVIWIKTGTSVSNLLFKPMINKGSAALPYAKYYDGIKSTTFKGIKLTDENENETNLVLFTTQQELKSTETAYDRFYITKNADNELYSLNKETNVISYVIKGTEMVINIWSESAHSVYGIKPLDAPNRIKLTNKNIINAISNYYSAISYDGAGVVSMWNSRVNTINKYIAINYMSVTDYWILIKDLNFIDDPSGFKSFLNDRYNSGNPIIVSYQVATPIIEVIRNDLTFNEVSAIAKQGGTISVIGNDSEEHGVKPNIKMVFEVDKISKTISDSIQSSIISALNTGV